MNTAASSSYISANRAAAPASGFATSLHEVVLCVLLISAFTALVWHLFAALPAYGAQPAPQQVAQVKAATLAPLCFDHTREQVEAEGVPQGCPADPMAYRPATIRLSNN